MARAKKKTTRPIEEIALEYIQAKIDYVKSLEHEDFIRGRYFELELELNAAIKELSKDGGN